MQIKFVNIDFHLTGERNVNDSHMQFSFHINKLNNKFNNKFTFLAAQIMSLIKITYSKVRKRKYDS